MAGESMCGSPAWLDDRRPRSREGGVCSRVACANFFLHVQGLVVSATQPTGDELLRVLSTLASPHRLRVVAALVRERNYVSRMARELGISRPLLQVHLRKLEAAGLVSAHLELSEDGKAMKFYEVISLCTR